MRNEVLAALLWFMAGFFTTSGLLTIASVGKPRKPISGGIAAISVMFIVLFVTVTVLAALVL